MILIWVRFCRTLMKKKKSDVHKYKALILYVLIVCTWNQNYQWGKKIDQVLKLSQEIEWIAIWKSRCRERPILSCHKCGTRKKFWVPIRNQTSNLEINAKLWSFFISFYKFKTYNLSYSIYRCLKYLKKNLYLHIHKK